MKTRSQAGEMFGFRLIRRLLSALILLILVVPLFSIGRTWNAAHNTVVTKADVIVVLGAAQFDGRPSPALEARLIEAERIYKAGLAPLIMSVGAGAPGDRTTEAASSKSWLLLHGIPKSDVIAIEKGRDTWVSTQSFVTEMNRRKLHTVILVTDPYHCLRATTMARDLGTASSCSPVRTGAYSIKHLNLHYLIRESGAYLAYVTLGRRGIHISDHLGPE